jgi:5-methylcytosine-specific restriction protein B
MTLSSVYKLNISLTDVMDIVNKNKPRKRASESNNKNYVFIIDEINRGNISKIFGELITLIEPTKRIGQLEEITVRLPYSKKLFGVPNNVYIIGTMNTADRSIATIDTALRRRFYFKEMQPNPKLLEDIMVEDLSISKMLTTINKRISVLYDREHTIGHAYFIPLRSKPTIELLSEIFSNNIIPLLQEYFYEDYEKIRIVLGDSYKENEKEQFIVAIINNYEELFRSIEIDFDESPTFEINRRAFDNLEAYRMI